jgi:TPR repeat protein
MKLKHMLAITSLSFSTVAFAEGNGPLNNKLDSNIITDNIRVILSNNIPLDPIAVKVNDLLNIFDWVKVPPITSEETQQPPNTTDAGCIEESIFKTQIPQLMLEKAPPIASEKTQLPYQTPSTVNRESQSGLHVEPSATQFPLEIPTNQLLEIPTNQLLEIPTNQLPLTISTQQLVSMGFTKKIRVGNKSYTIRFTEKNSELSNWDPLIEHLIKQGDPMAKQLLSRDLLEGNGVKKDTTLALKLLRSAAKKNHLDSIKDLYLLYWRGLYGIKMDKQKALKWALKAVEQGDLVSMNDLGCIYESMGNLEDAFKHYMLAAEGNSHVAEYNVGRYFLHGRTVPINQDLAIEYFNRSCLGNYPDACFNLAQSRHQFYPSEYSVSDKNSLIAHAARLGSNVAIDECKALGISY